MGMGTLYYPYMSEKVAFLKGQIFSQSELLIDWKKAGTKWTVGHLFFGHVNRV